MKSFVRWLRAVAILGAWALVIVVIASCSKSATSENSGSSDLVQTAADGAGEEQITAIDDLGERHDDATAAIPVLEKLLASDNEQLRWRSARALGDFGDQALGSAPALQKLLTDANPIVQYHAVVALGRVGDKSDATIDALVTAIGNPDPRIARAAIASLRTLEPKPPQVLAALQQALNSDDDAIVLHAMQAIADHGADAVPMLDEALKQPQTAYVACTVIAEIGPKAAATVPNLTALLGETKHSQLQIEAMLALAGIGPAAQSASPQIIPLLETSTDATVPVAAAYALGAIHAADADAPLKAALAKPNPFLQMVAAWSLARIHPDDAQLRQQAMDKLQEGLKSDDPAIKAAAEKGLLHMSPPAAAAAP